MNLVQWVPTAQAFSVTCEHTVSTLETTEMSLVYFASINFSTIESPF